jgi:muramoyltetrapeptide carboxypeptidase
VPGLLKPRALRPGGAIGVAATSGPVDEEKLEAGLRALEAKGYRIVEADNLRRKDRFLAGTDRERADGYRRLLRDPSVDAIFFARGGYGSARLLSLLDPAEASASPKLHLGGSDLTALFAWLTQEAGCVAHYGPMVAVEMCGEDGLDWQEVLTTGRVPCVRFERRDVLAGGTAEGPLVGGCLSLLASLAGTPAALRADGCVLFWEDVGEAAYRLDRMLTQLEQAGTFDTLRGMVIGSATPPAGETPASVREWLADRLGGAPFPVALGLPAGHVPRPRTLPLGVTVRLSLDGEPALEFLEAAVVPR